MLSPRLKRWISITVLSVLAFSQANVVLAACSMDRGMVGHAMAATAEDPCAGCDTTGSAAASPSLCVTHCTSDLQLATAAPAGVPAPAVLPTLFLVPLPEVPRPVGLDAPPPGTPPHRILLHSFLI